MNVVHFAKAPKRIAIVGGGIAGVAAAYELARQGQRDFVLFEASPRLGGTVETVRVDGFVIECGPDSWVSEKPWARELAVELGLEDEIIPSNDANRRTYLAEGDNLVAVPDGMRMMVPGDMGAIAESPLFSEGAKRAYESEAGRAEELKAYASRRPPDADESVASFVRRHFGDEVTEKIAGPLLAGVFGGRVEELSAAAVMPAFVKMELEYGSLVLAVREQHREPGQRRTVFTTLRSGLQTLIDAMTRAIPDACLRLSEPVISLAREGSGWRLDTGRGPEYFDAMVLATPADMTQKLLAPVDAALAGMLAIEATSAIVIALAFDCGAAERIRIPPGFGFLVPQRETEAGSELSLLACTFVDQKFPGRVPEGGKLLRAFYGGDAAAALLDKTDEEMVRRAIRQLSRILGSIPEPKLTLVRRWPGSLPQYAVGHLNRVAEIEARVADIPGLSVAGNAYHGVGLPDLVRQGRAVARVLVSGRDSGPPAT